MVQKRLPPPGVVVSTPQSPAPVPAKRELSTLEHVKEFVRVMTPYQKAWLGGSAFIGLIALFFAIAGQSQPTIITTLLSGFMFMRACFFTFTDEHNKRLQAEIAAADAASLAAAQIAALEQRVYELEHPPIQVKAEMILLDGGTDVLSPNREWQWNLTLTLRITPSTGRTFTLHNDCGAVIMPEPMLTEHPLLFQFNYFAPDDADIIDASQAHVTQSSTIVCKARTVGAGWVDPLPDKLIATVDLVDGNSEWRKSLTVGLIRNTMRSGPRKEWVG